MILYSSEENSCVASEPIRKNPIMGVANSLDPGAEPEVHEVKERNGSRDHNDV